VVQSVGAVMRRRSVLRLLALVVCVVACRAAERPEALLVIVGDLHSAYERTAQLVGHVDRLKQENPAVPLAVLIDGDSFELGNAVARRTAGAIDFAMFTALAARGPTVVNLGNHEPEFHDVPETVKRIHATGARVVSGNLRDASGKPYAPASVTLELGPQRAVVAGFGTDRLSTYRVAVRPQLAIADPAVWAAQHLSQLFRGAVVPIVLSHAGLRVDRAILPIVPERTLFVGAHDHLRLIHREGNSVYVHAGSWIECFVLARLIRRGAELAWDVEEVPVTANDPADPKLSKLIRETLERELTAEEKQIVGRTAQALAPSAAARFAVEAARRAAGADVAVIGATTFGGGLPAGEVPRRIFDACVRFDGTLFVGEIDGSALRSILARANQGPSTPFAKRSGENLVAAAPDSIDEKRSYRLVTTDWVAKNAKSYLGENPPALVERSDLKLKAAVLAALNR
jgi:5'-nucleotidase/UDP-sugar diphosphatase